MFKTEYAFLCNTLWTKTWRLCDLVRPSAVLNYTIRIRAD